VTVGLLAYPYNIAMRERIHSLTTPEATEVFLQQPLAAIFKAGTCHKTMQGWGNVEKMLFNRPEIPVGVIKVVEYRPASNYVAEKTGIVHHSPQIIMFRSGQALWDLDNWNITLDNLEPLFEQHLSDVKTEAASSTSASNLEPYARLMDAYLAGAISEQQFSFTYLNTFREDASLRSQEEFALINSLFGNPDQHHIHPAQIMAQFSEDQEPLRLRVEALRQRLS
jgi:bacillithiol system protein YtxJ